MPSACRLPLQCGRLPSICSDFVKTDIDVFRIDVCWPSVLRRRRETAPRLPRIPRGGIAPPMFENLSAFRDALNDLPCADSSAREQAAVRQNLLTKPPGSLGALEEVAVFLAGWGCSAKPTVQRARLVIFAGNHGVVARGVSPYPSDVTAQMVANFETGGAACNAFTRELGVALDVVPLELDRPTRDFCEEPALDETELLGALNAGADVVSADDDVLVLGEMGIGNTTVAAALAARSFGGAGQDWVGPGTGLDGAGVAHKAAVVDRALAHHAGEPVDAVTTLRLVGGRETAAIVGAIVAARHARVPVLLDGYVVCSAVAPVFQEKQDIVAHCIAGHVSAEPAHIKLLDKMGLAPLLDLGMRLGEGTGGVLAVALLRAACAAHNGMATFEEAQVAGRSADKECVRDA